MRWSVSAAIVALVLASTSTIAKPQELNANLWGTNGNILGIARSGTKIYVAGNFTRVGPNTGSFVPVDRNSGTVPGQFPKVAGVLKAAVPDGEGGWFLAGGITGVAGIQSSGLSHVLANGRVAEWSPNPNGWVHAMTLKGDTVLVGGTFTQIDGFPRMSIAAIDANTGDVLDWAPEADGLVRTLLVAGSSLYVGGDFSHIGGEQRRGVAKIDLATGLTSDWNPDVTVAGGAGSVRALANVGDTLYIGGLFNRVGDQYRVNLAAIDMSTALATSWDPQATSCNCNSLDPSPYVSALVPGVGTIYVSGHFSILGGIDRGGVAEVDLISGVPTPWDPRPGPRRTEYAPNITALAITQTTAYIAGDFTEIAGLARYTLAEVDRESGDATGWDPQSDVAPSILIPQEDVIYLGGSVGLMGCVERRCLAAFDSETGEVTDWNPNPNGLFANSVAVQGDRVFVAGDFSQVGGQDHFGLAAVDTLAGSVLEWTADTNNLVRRLEIVGDRLIAVGGFTTVGGSLRSGLASFNIPSGELDSLDFEFDSDVYVARGAGNVLYVGGFFRSIGGEDYKHAAAIDLTTGSLLDWHPDPDQWVNAIAIKDSTVFLGGAFSSLNGVQRERLAAVSTRTGTLRMDWVANTANANPNTNRVHDLAIAGSTLYVGGSMDSIGGKIRNGLAALDAETGQVLDWDPKLTGANVHEPLEPGIPWSLATSGNALYAGGLFLWSGTRPASTLASLSLIPETPPPPGPAPSAISMSVPYPNPVVSAATVRFALPIAAAVDLAIYDARGRRVELLLEGSLQTAGPHEIPIRSSGWSSGFYFCRLDVNGETVARKFVVLR
ncbi:MAG: T9SS type A sorting domain-containing protein [Candidatus Eiseniibacteriota bacterium]